ncbi:MAG: IMPACT family protein [Lentisphaeria bacterium]|nr:IMPACT family protein [Lentisphaeria bacterium]
MLILVEPATAEIVIRNSRFMAEAFVVGDAESARERLRAQKERRADASHVVHAFVIGSGANVLGCSDDGEPAGTAGRPALEVLKGSGITNVMVTITRYFGGVKLGTGGLVKAYTEAVQSVLAKAVTRELTAQTEFSLQAPYSCYEPVRRLLAEAEAEVVAEAFAGQVEVRARMRDAEFAEFARKVADLSNGQAKWTVCDDGATSA